ncbi:MAG: hypothetical protein AABZ44_04450, partial [Elusimicrobiota bacterium]
MEPLLLARRRSVINWIRQIRRDRWETVKSAGVILFGLMLLGCLHWWFLRMLTYVAAVPIIGNLLTNKLLEMAFLSAFSLVALSALVTSLSTHFGSADINLLRSWPLTHWRV